MPEVAQAAIDNTIQVIPDAKKNSLGIELWQSTARGPILERLGTRARELQLWNVYNHDYNAMLQGTFAGIMKLVAGANWEIRGPADMPASEVKHWRRRYAILTRGKAAETERPDIEYWQEVIRQAHFGRGWTDFVMMGVDYLRQDAGWYWEIIAPGSPDKPITGAVMGIAHLDSLRCYPTQDIEYPVLYHALDGKYHLMHRTRVRQLVDMPEGRETYRGYGKCALSRAISVANREVLMNQYIEAMLDDKPPPGLVVTNMVRGEREKALAEYRREQNNDATPVWGRQLWFYVPDPNIKPVLETNSFSQAPEKFDWRNYVEVDVDQFALAVGIDRQDIWQLSGGNLGSGAQSQVLHQKSKGKTIGTLFTTIERILNDILPEEYEFEFKLKDAQEDTDEATNAQVWAGVVTSLGATLTPDEQRELLASKVEAIKDAITDENGNIRRVGDLDVQPDEEIADDADTNVGDPAGSGGLDNDVGGRDDTDTPKETRKAIQSTRIDFEDAFADAIRARVSGDITPTRFGIIARDLLRRYGLQAFRDGLEDGGVSPYAESGALLPLDPEDNRQYTKWLAEQAVYVSNLNKELRGVESLDADSRATMWGNKSLTAIYDAGRVSADKNGMYEWALGNTEEHCKDCLRLNGQVHRLKDYMRKGWLPKSDRLSCHGFNCDCSLIKTTERAKGRF